MSDMIARLANFVACTFALAALAAPVSAQEDASPRQKPVQPVQQADLKPRDAHLGFDKREHNFGKVFTNEPVTTTFTFTNNSDVPVVIERVRTSCGCTTTKLEKLRFEPGEGETIEATIRPKSPGVNRQTVTVLIAEPAGLQPPQLVLSLDYAPAVKLERPRMQIGDVAAGENGPVGELVLHSREEGIEVTQINIVTRDRSGQKRTRIDPPTKPENGWPASEDADYEYTIPIPVYLADGAKDGRFSEQIAIQITHSDGTAEIIRGNVIGNITGDILSDPLRVRLRQDEVGGPFTARIRVHSAGGRAFAITRTEFAQAVNAEFSITVEGADEDAEPVMGPPPPGAEPEVAQATEHWIVIKAEPSIEGGVFRSDLQVFTDVSQGPITVPITGIIAARRGV